MQKKGPSTSIYCTCICITKLMGKTTFWGGWGCIKIYHKPFEIKASTHIWNSVFHILIPHFTYTFWFGYSYKIHKLNAVPVRSCYFFEHNPLGQLCWRNIPTRKCFPGWRRGRSHPWWNSTPGSGDWRWTGNRRGWNTTGWCYCHCSAAGAKIWMILWVVKAGIK